jgi:hypothetical protein
MISVDDCVLPKNVMSPLGWVCVIFFSQVVVFERLHWARRGVRGGVAGRRSPPRGGSGAAPPKFFFRADIFSAARGRHISGRHISGPHDIRWFFGTWFFADGFLFPVKELGFWTNPGHWVRVLDVAGSYMYIVL